MSVLIASRGAQWLKTAEFTFNFNDTMLDVNGVSKDFGLTNTSATTWEIIKLPPGSTVQGGEIVTETAFDTASYAVVLGDSTTADRYHASADLKGAARVAVLTPGFRNTAGLNVRIGITNADACTAGKMTVRVNYTVADQINEAVPA